MRALIGGALIGGADVAHHANAPGRDRLSAPGHDVDDRLTDHGASGLGVLGIDLDVLYARRRPLVRYCAGWTEQAHLRAGALGGAVATRLFELGWLCHAPTARAVGLTEAGRDGLGAVFALRFDADPSASARASAV
ncbi:MAG: hypothetical protein ACRDY3_11865 [Acidimicrobiales bacterium]